MMHGGLGPLPFAHAVPEQEEEIAAPRTIHEAAQNGDLSWIVRTVERTLDYDINSRDRLQRTALHW